MESVPVALLLDQLFGRVWMRDLMWWSLVDSASMRWLIVGVC